MIKFERVKVYLVTYKEKDTCLKVWLLLILMALISVPEKLSTTYFQKAQVMLLTVVYIDDHIDNKNETVLDPYSNPKTLALLTRLQNNTKKLT